VERVGGAKHGSGVEHGDGGDRAKNCQQGIALWRGRVVRVKGSGQAERVVGAKLRGAKGNRAKHGGEAVGRSRAAGQSMMTRRIVESSRIPAAGWSLA
jgi:hypothetical protein